MTTYALDPTGISPANRIVDETKVITPPTVITDANFVVPNITPFFKEGFVIRLGTRTLVEGVDFQFVFRHIAASTHFTREIFGGLMFINKQFSGTVNMTYQVLGGDFTNPDPSAITEFSKAVGAVRWLTFDQILGVPSSFPPAYHEHDLEKDLVDMGDVVDAVELLAKAVRDKDDHAIAYALNQHISAQHAHSKASVGLGNVANYLPGSYEDAQKGTHSKYVTTDILKLWWERHASKGFSVDLSGFYTSKQIDDMVASIRTSISNLPTMKDVNTAITAAIKPLNDKISSFKIDFEAADFKNAVELIYSERIETLNSSLTAVRRQVDTNTENIATLTKGLADSISNAAATYVTKKDYNTGIESSDDRFNSILKTIDTQNRSLTSQANTLKTLNSDLTNLSNQITQFNTRLESMMLSCNTYPYGPTGEYYQGRIVTYKITLTIETDISGATYTQSGNPNISEHESNRRVYSNLKIQKYGSNTDMVFIRDHMTVSGYNLYFQARNTNYSAIDLTRPRWFTADVDKYAVIGGKVAFELLPNRDEMRLNLLTTGTSVVDVTIYIFGD